MDRISALRNIEDALADFEAGEATLQDLERDVRAVLRTYATEFEGDLDPFEAEGGDADGLVVLAASRPDARDRVETLVEDPGRFEIERVD